MSRPKSSCRIPQTSPLGPQKDKNDPKIMSNSNVKIQGILGYETCLTTWVDPKTEMSELKEKKKVKIVALYE